MMANDFRKAFKLFEAKDSAENMKTLSSYIF